jgi:hypothetical protein
MILTEESQIFRHGQYYGPSRVEMYRGTYRHNIGRREVCDSSLKIILTIAGLRQPVPVCVWNSPLLGCDGGTTW